MRILFLANSFNVGGYEQLMLEVFRHLTRDGTEIKACCLKEEGTLAPELRRIGIPVISGFLGHRYDLFGLIRIRRALKGERFHLMFVELGRNALLVGEHIASALGIPRRVTSIHATRPGGTRKLFRRGQRRMIRRLDGVIACAETQKEYLVRDEGVDPEKLTVIVNGIDHEKFRPLRGEDLPPFDEGPAGGEKGVAIVASLTPEKGHSVFVDAAAITLKEVPHARFFIIGDGPERPGIEARIVEKGLGSKVRLLGIRRDLPTLLPHLDLIALSSLPFRETLPLSTMEGMACGLPAVNSDVGSVRDLIIDGETGFIVPHGDAQAMARAFIRLLLDEKLAERMGGAARKRIEERFTLQRAVREYGDYFRRVVVGSGQM